MTTSGARGWALAIDLGAMWTAAAWRDPAGGCHELRLSAGGNLLPSGGFSSGPAASWTPTIQEVLRVAVLVAGSTPSEVRLTCPGWWDLGARESLARAAVGAGVPADRALLVAGEQAVVSHYQWRSPTVAVGERVAVLDLGAGTCDLAVLRKGHDGHFTALEVRRLDGPAGNRVDERILDWVRGQLSAGHPGRAAELDSAAGYPGRQLLMDRIRHAKETLTSQPTASLQVPRQAGDLALTLSRGELEELIAGDLAQLAAQVREVFSRTGIPSRLYLAGGASLTPLVAAEIGTLAPMVDDGADRHTVVALGALLAPAAAWTGGLPMTPTPATATPAAPTPVTSSHPDPPPRQRKSAVVALLAGLVVIAVAAGLTVAFWPDGGSEGEGGEGSSVASESATAATESTAATPVPEKNSDEVEITAVMREYVGALIDGDAARFTAVLCERSLAKADAIADSPPLEKDLPKLESVTEVTVSGDSATAVVAVTIEDDPTMPAKITMLSFVDEDGWKLC